MKSLEFNLHTFRDSVGHGKTETVRVAKPPYNVKHLTPLQWNGIFSLSQKDHRDYIAEFLEMDVRRVKDDREPLYSDPYTVVDRLSKGTIVRVLGSEQKSGHVQIEYYNAENKIDTGLVIGSFLSTAIQDERGFDKPVASFDCQRSKSTIEQLICSDHHLGLLDIWLNDAYKQAKFFRPQGAEIQPTGMDKRAKWVYRQGAITPPTAGHLGEALP